MIFSSARLRLTAWYLLIIGSVIIAFSVSLFFVSRNSINRSHQKQIAILRDRGPDFEEIRVNQEAIDTELAELFHQLLVIDLALISIAGVLSFILATQTLEPIRSSLERQRQFVSNASHELKTPLATLQAEIDITLKRDRSKSEYVKTLRYLRKEVVRLTKLSKNLLILAGSNEKIIQPEQIELTELIKESLSAFKNRLDHNRLKLNLEQVKIRGDRIQLRQMVDIFIDNAIKYSPKGGVISITVDSRGRTANLIFFNAGKRIAKKDQDHIFKRFFRGSSGVKAVKGVGLGLAIAQTIVNNHQGELRLDSRAKKGTRLVVALPIAGPKSAKYERSRSQKNNHR